MASSIGTTWTEGLCNNQQVQLIRIMENNYPGTKPFITGTLNCLTSSMYNTNNVLQEQIDSNNGARNQDGTYGKAVRIKYTPRTAYDDVTDARETSCVSTNTRPPCDEITTIEQAASINWNVPQNELRKLCEGDQATYNTELLNSKLQALIKKVNNNVAVQLATDKGLYEDDSTDKSYKLINSADGSLYYLGESEMKEDMRKAELAGPVTVIGAGNWHHYMNLVNIGGLQDTGVLTNRAGDMQFFYDDFVESSTVLNGANKAFILGQNAAQFLTWNANRGDYALFMEDKFRTTVIDPRTGITVDYWGEMNTCADGPSRAEWSFGLELYYDLWTPPSDVWTASDNLAGVNYIFEAEGTAS